MSGPIFENFKNTIFSNEKLHKRGFQKVKITYLLNLYIHFQKMLKYPLYDICFSLSLPPSFLLSYLKNPESYDHLHPTPNTTTLTPTIFFF